MYGGRPQKEEKQHGGLLKRGGESVPHGRRKEGDQASEHVHRSHEDAQVGKKRSEVPTLSKGGTVPVFCRGEKGL